MHEISPCLTRSRAGTGGHWLTWKQRFMHTEEILRLMGVDMASIPQGVVSDRALRLMAGNAVSVDLLSLVLGSLLDAAGLV